MFANVRSDEAVSATAFLVFVSCTIATLVPATFSTFTVVPANWFTPAPAGYSHAEAATLTTAGLTAQHESSCNRAAPFAIDDDRPLGKKVGQIVHGRKVVTASDGTFVLEFRGGLKPTGASTAEVNGRFVLKKGTNAYKGLHGSGRIHATLDSASGSITAVYTGKGHAEGG